MHTGEVQGHVRVHVWTIVTGGVADNLPYIVNSRSSGAPVVFFSMLEIHPFAEPQPCNLHLPSFKELLTTIPLPHEFYDFSSDSSSSNIPTQLHLQLQPQSQTQSRPYSSSFSLPQPLPASPMPSLPAIAELPSPSDLTSRRETPSYDAASPHLPLSSSSTVPEEPSAATSDLTTTTAGRGRTPTKGRKHVCKWCLRSFTTLGHLARHNRIHTGERKHQCPWPQCGAKFARQDNCMQHYKTHTSSRKRKRLTK